MKKTKYVVEHIDDETVFEEEGQLSQEDADFIEWETWCAPALEEEAEEEMTEEERELTARIQARIAEQRAQNTSFFDEDASKKHWKRLMQWKNEREKNEREMMDETIELELGYTPANLKKIRREKKLSQAELGALVGRVARSVRAWELPADNPRHSDMPHALWLELLAKLEIKPKWVKILKLV